MMLINTLLLAIASVASATMLSEREYQELADLESRAVPNCFTIYSLIQCQGTCDFTGAGDECGASYCYQECCKCRILLFGWAI